MHREFFAKRYEEINGKIVEFKLKPSLRVNTLKISPKELKIRLEEKGVKLERIKFVNNGFYYESKFSLGATTEYLLGYYYLQEAASMIPAEVLNPNNKDLVLDMAAAPGSKTTQISQIMNNQGLIIAFEKNPKRAFALKNNVERMGCKNVCVINEDILNLKTNIQFDKILLDAPCSGNYLSQKGWFSKRDLNGIIRNSEYQKKLIRKAHELLKENGILVYSTCSLEPEEDEEVVDFALKLGFKILPTQIKIGDEGITKFKDKNFSEDLKFAKRLWPYKTKTQGFFIAKLKKVI
ncbi:MAG: RsmB/NOP family class I SAM-dependent RNA methyltransferase [Candidatus Woesearchaeota archaeon]